MNATKFTIGLTIFFFGPAQFSLATVLSKSQTPEKNIVKEFEQTKSSLLQIELSQREVLSSLFEINKNMKKTVTKKSKLSSERLLAQQESKKMAALVLELNQKISSQKKLLQQRLRFIYQFGDPGWLRMVLSSKSSAELDRLLRISVRLSQMDLRLINNYSQNIKLFEQKKKKFLAQLQDLKQIEVQMQTEEEALGAQNDSKMALLTKLRSSKQKKLLNLAQIRSEKENLDPEQKELLDLLLRPTFFEKKGSFKWPVVGKVKTPYGLMRDPDYQVSLFHKGVFLETNIQQTVKALYHGQVTYQSEIPGLGSSLIIDHGDHYYTVYVGIKNSHLKIGDPILPDQPLGQVSYSSNYQKNGVYFEIRHFSEADNPQAWMKGT